jgi:hypothetical protein
VWNEQFRFNVINENSVSIQLLDEDVTFPDLIGNARIDLARTRTFGSDTVQAPVMTKNGKQHGFVQVALSFAKNSALMQPQPQALYHPATHPPQPSVYAPPAAAYYPPPATAAQYHPPAPIPSSHPAGGGGTLEAGELILTLEFAQGLKDKELFVRQDPYCIITCGGQRYQSRTHIDGGRSPV